MTMEKPIRSLLLALTLLAALAPPSPGQSADRKVSYIPYDDARPILELLDEVVPAELKSGDRPAAWAAWVARRDAEIRARLVQGDEDSLVNFLLFGTSYTRRPRVTLKELAQVKQNAGSPEAAAFVEAIKARAGDMVQGMVAPATNERLLFAR